jgi:isoquinoline 1-oxidoreductase subunit beta
MNEPAVSTRALSRRSFLVTVGAFNIAVAFGALPRLAFATAGPVAFQPNAWVSIDADGIVTIMSAAAEMGQGSMTALPLLVAEDLDADWSKVKVVQCPPDAKTYGTPAFANMLITVGSTSVVGYYDRLRLVGAQARKILLANAADAWHVPVGELSTEPGIVVHAGSGRRLGYGEIARRAKLPTPLPQAVPADLKPLAQCRLIGKDIPRVELPTKVNGTAKFGIDTQLPNMLYAAVLHPPVQGETASSIDDLVAKTIPGIVKIMPLPTGVAVVGNSVEATKLAKGALNVTWTTSARARHYTSSQIGEEYRAIAADWSRPSAVMAKQGDAAAALRGATKTLTAEFYTDHVAHACMEPMNATALFDGKGIEIWASNQSVTSIQLVCAPAVGLPPERILVHSPLLGGGFGRRTDGDEVIEAALIAKSMPGQAIKVVWSREDDIQNDKFRPLVLQRVEVGLDEHNRITAWRQRVVCESYMARALPGMYTGTGGKDIVTAGGGEFSYDVAHHLVDYVRAPRGVDVGAWRGISANYMKFAIETLIDEIAVLNRADPVAFRLGILQHEPRAATLVQAVASMSGWGTSRAEGRALGVAYSDGVSRAATVAEVSLNRDTGAIRVHHIWAAVDPGVAVQPQNIVAQMEGGIIFGLGQALYEQITIQNGEVQQANFSDYRVLRMSDVPEIDVRVLPTNNPPSGIGEAGVPGVAPAIANAVAKLTGLRIRQIPMLPQRVKTLLSY